MERRLLSIIFFCSIFITSVRARGESVRDSPDTCKADILKPRFTDHPIETHLYKDQNLKVHAKCPAGYQYYYRAENSTKKFLLTGLEKLEGTAVVLPDSEDDDGTPISYLEWYMYMVDEDCYVSCCDADTGGACSCELHFYYELKTTTRMEVPVTVGMLKTVLPIFVPEPTIPAVISTTKKKVAPIVPLVPIFLAPESAQVVAGGWTDEDTAPVKKESTSLVLIVVAMGIAALILVIFLYICGGRYDRRHQDQQALLEPVSPGGTPLVKPQHQTGPNEFLLRKGSLANEKWAPSVTTYRTSVNFDPPPIQLTIKDIRLHPQKEEIKPFQYESFYP